MYRINTATGDIYCPDGWVCNPPYDDIDLPKYLKYAEWIHAGNSPEYFSEEPLPPVPTSVNRFQARAALYQAGYLDQVNQMMAAESTPMMAKLAWQDAQEFYRDSALVQSMGGALSLSSTQLDDLFRLAATIVA